MGQVVVPSTCPITVRKSPVPPVSPSPSLLGKGRSEGDFSGLFSVKQRVPSRPREATGSQSGEHRCGGSTTLEGHLPSETKCPDPPANLFPPPTFFELFPRNNVSRPTLAPSPGTRGEGRGEGLSSDVATCPVPALVQSPVVQSPKSGSRASAILDLGPWTLGSRPVPRSAVGHEFRGSPIQKKL